MEKDGAYHLEKQIVASEVSEILQVDVNILANLVNHGIVLPVKNPMGAGDNLWGPQEVFRAFVGLQLVREFETKYGKDFDRFKYDQVHGDLLRTMRVKGKEIRQSEEWKKVAKKATEHGLFFK